MKKSFLLTLLLTLCCTLTAWSQFNPTPGVKYALREKTSGLYLDIQTLGIHEPNNETNSISLNTNPCIIYFEAGNDSKWHMKNVNGTYASNFTSGRDWNTSISSTSYDWIITTGNNGLTIAKDQFNYIGWDKENAITAGRGEGMVTMDSSIIKLYKDGIITKETAINFADHPDLIQKHL